MEGNDTVIDAGQKKTIVYAIIAACVMGMIVIGALVLYSGSTSEGFSELYFEDYQQIAKIVDAEQDVMFKFTLMSHEKTPVTYKYNVTFKDEIIDKGDIRLEPETNKTLNVTFVPHNSSLIPFDVSRLAVFNTKLNQDGEVQLPLPGSAEALVTINLRDAKVPEWNFTEIERVGSLEALKPVEKQNTVSSLGYSVRNDRYSIEDTGQLKALNYSLNVTEYRYKFEKVAVTVTSEKRLTFKAGEPNQVGLQKEKDNAYEIYFWIIVKDMPEKLLAL